MRKHTFIATVLTFLAGAALPASADDSETITVSVAVLPGCVVEMDADANEPRVLCNMDARTSQQAQDGGDPSDRPFAPVIESLEAPAGPIVRVTL
jgi:hypothetical protein